MKRDQMEHGDVSSEMMRWVPDAHLSQMLADVIAVIMLGQMLGRCREAAFSWILWLSNVRRSADSAFANRFAYMANFHLTSKGSTVTRYSCDVLSYISCTKRPHTKYFPVGTTHSS